MTHYCFRNTNTSTTRLLISMEGRNAAYVVRHESYDLRLIDYVSWTRVYIVRPSADRTSWAYYDVMRPLHLKFKGFLTLCFYGEIA